jgi:hypothetical protein
MVPLGFLVRFSVLPPPAMTRIICNDRLWMTFAAQAVARGQEIELVNLDHEEDGDFCESLAGLHAMLFTIDPETGYGRFTKNGR